MLVFLGLFSFTWGMIQIATLVYVSAERPAWVLSPMVRLIAIVVNLPTVLFAMVALALLVGR